MIRKLCRKIKTQTAQLARTQQQQPISDTHTEIGLLLTERQESERDQEVVTEVRALLDKNDAAIDVIEIELDEGV